MPYKKKISKAIANAKVRISGMKSVDPDLDMGGGLSIATYTDTIHIAEQKVEAYNTAIAIISQLSSDAEQAEKTLADFSERMLSTVAGRYGKASNEYEMAGGTRRTGRRRSPKKKVEVPETPVTV